MPDDAEAKQQILWMCRFHPTEWFHEVGCPHQEWTKEQLQSALETSKRGNLVVLETFKTQLEALAQKATKYDTLRPLCEEMLAVLKENYKSTGGCKCTTCDKTFAIIQRVEAALKGGE